MVAPIKVNRPLSTWGKKASCWLLLKRCTSSTKTKVAWGCKPWRASWPAARVAYVFDAAQHGADGDEPARQRHAPSAAQWWFCPHLGAPKMQLCGRADSNAMRSGMPSPSRCRAYHLAQGAWAQQFGQWGSVKGGGHGAARRLPIEAALTGAPRPPGAGRGSKVSVAKAGLASKRVKLSTERWPKLSVISSTANSVPRRPISTCWICPSREVGTASTHCRRRARTHCSVESALARL